MKSNKYTNCSVPNTKTFSEAWVTANISEMHQKRIISVPECKSMVKSTFRLLCKLSEEEKVDTFFFKMTFQDNPLFPYIAEAFPHIKLFFNTRYGKNPFYLSKNYKSKFIYFQASSTIIEVL